MKNMVLTTTVAAWLCVQAVYGQENSCSVHCTKEGCAKRVICNFSDIVLREKREFIISLRADSGDEMIADCNWVRSGKFDCDPATGYTCDPQLSVIFSVNITKPEKCIRSGEFLFEVAHEKPFSCKIAPVQVLSEEKMNSDNASASTNHKSPNKCRNSTNENENGPNQNKRSTDESEDRCQEGASEQESNTGMIIGVVCPCLLAGVVASLLIVKRRKLVTFVRKRKGHKGTCVEGLAYNPAVKDFENKFLMPETADSTKADTLKETDGILGAVPLGPASNPELNINIINMNPTEQDAACDVRLLHYASSYDGDDNDCGRLSKHT